MTPQEARRLLAGAGVDDPATDVRRLLDFARNQCTGPGASESEIAERFEVAIRRRMKREPVSHITGIRAFWKSEFSGISPEVLDPRPETETLVEKALSEPFSRVLDLGTGSGCILISLLAECPPATGVGTDISAMALAIAKENAERIGVAGRCEFLMSDWLSGVEGQYDLIVSNPPYIGAADMEALAPEVRDHEPSQALTDGADGLTAYRRIAESASRHLVPGGRLLVEIGPEQASAVTRLFGSTGVADIQVHPDLDGRDRVVSGRKA